MTTDQNQNKTIDELTKANLQLQADKEDLRQLKESLDARVRELDCLYGLSRLVERKELVLDDIFQGLVKLIPPAWHYPDITCARLIFGDSTFATDNFRETRWKQSAPISTKTGKTAVIEVYYLQERPELDEGPFLTEERKLLKVLAERIGHIIDQKHDEEALKAANQQLDAANQQLAAANQQLEAYNQQLNAANQQLEAYNQQLNAANQQLEAANQQLDAANQQLDAANQQLVASQKEIESLAKFPSENPNPVLRISANGAIIYANKAATAILDTWHVGEDEHVPEPYSTHIQKAFSSGEVSEVELVCNDGRTFAFTLAPVVYAGYVNIYGLDITERKQIKAQLQKYSEQLEVMVEKRTEELAKANKILNKAQQIAHLGNWKWDLASNTLTWSDEIYRIFDVPMNDFNTTYGAFLNAVHPDDREYVKRSVKQALRERKPYNIEHRIVLPDGTVRTVNEQAEIEYDESGKPIEMVGIVQDISEYKQAMNTILKYQEQLQNIMARLMIAEEHEKRRIAEIIHDEVIQPLVFFRMKLNELKNYSPGADFDESLESLEDMTGDLLQHMRSLSYGLSSPILYDMGLESTIKEWLYKEIHGKHGINVGFYDDEQPKPLEDDAKTLLYRSVKELLTNVAKHAEAKNVQVEICATEGKIRIKVEDDGKGFTPPQDNLHRDQAGGLGLFLVAERMRQCRGDLQIDSTPGKGTRIYLHVPLKTS